VSSLQRFWRCPEQWGRHYIDHQREPATPAMLLGKAVCKAVARHPVARLPPGKLPRRPRSDSGPAA
jgi:hypothetical protein